MESGSGAMAQQPSHAEFPGIGLEELPAEVMVLLLRRSFVGRPPLSLHALSSAWKQAISLEATFLVVGRPDCDQTDCRVDFQSARTAICSALSRLSHLQSVDLRCLPGPPIACMSLFQILQALPGSVNEVMLPKIAISCAKEITKLRRLLSHVDAWSCDVTSAVEDNGPEPFLFPGAVLIASPIMPPPFRDSVIMLIGLTGPGEFGEWFGVVLNGPVVQQEGGCVVRRGGPIGSPDEIWHVRASKFGTPERQRRHGIASAARSGTLIGFGYIGDDWEAWQDTSLDAPSGTRLFRGDCGWHAMQLEHEVKSGDWDVLCCPALLLLGDAPQDGMYARLKTLLGPLHLH